MASGSDPILIIGSGAAGVMTAQALRRRGHAGPIEVIGEEPAHTYDRPPLSKHVLAGAWEPDRAILMPAARLDQLEVEWSSARAVALDLERRSLQTADGDEKAYSQLVIATGAKPRTLPWAGERAHTLRTMKDALRLREALTGGRRLAIVGAGFIGLEVAATARGLGAEVSVVEPLEEPLAARLTPPVAARLVALHRERGVDLRTGVGATGFDGGSLALSDGEAIETDALLVAIGCVPNVDWLQGSGLTLEDGVVCDEFCRAAEGVWAAGDVARWHHPGIGSSLRIEHRMNATEQAAAVAANLLGAGEPFAPIPFFWTDQFDVKLQVWGALPPESEPELAEGDLDGERFVLVCRRPEDGEVVGAIGWNSPKQMASYRAQIAAAWQVRA